jgi:lipopolysaccharide transport system ATP-binding protein
MNAIECNGIWKKFQKGEKLYALRDAIPAVARKLFLPNGRKAEALGEDEFWALKNVNFQVKKGAILGIIGPNGAGKSTILKLLSRIIKPDRGEFRVQGRLSALVEVTAGFHPDFTGRENVYFNGAVYGMSRAEIDKKFDQIVDFSGVKEFIDTPVKRYSSGMSARLGFAVAAHVDPEILLVDEVLSVGDMTFQAKCTQKMRELLNSGVTIIFISHNTSLVESLCERVLLLSRGEIIKEGYPEDVIPFYENLIFCKREEGLEKWFKEEGNSSAYRLEVNEEAFVRIPEVRICDEEGHPHRDFEMGESLHINVRYDILKPTEELVFSFEIVRSDEILCCSSNTKREGFSVPRAVGENTLKIELNDLSLCPGVYFIKVSVWDKDMVHPYLVKKQGIFTIVSPGLVKHLHGIFLPHPVWKTEKQDSKIKI